MSEVVTPLASSMIANDVVSNCSSSSNDAEAANSHRCRYRSVSAVFVRALGWSNRSQLTGAEWFCLREEFKPLLPPATNAVFRRISSGASPTKSKQTAEQITIAHASRWRCSSIGRNAVHGTTARIRYSKVACQRSVEFGRVTEIRLY